MVATTLLLGARWLRDGEKPSMRPFAHTSFQQIVETAAAVVVCPALDLCAGKPGCPEEASFNNLRAMIPGDRSPPGP